MSFKLIVTQNTLLKYFTEYIDTFEDCKRISEFEINYTDLSNCEELICVLRGTWLSDDILKKCKKISIANTEQLCDKIPEDKMKTELLELERRCGYKVKVYDYSLENCKILNNIGYETEYRPYLSTNKEIEYLKSLSTSDKIYDVGFVGSLNHRRQEIIDNLQKENISVKVIQTYGNERDIELAKCKYIINIHWAAHFVIFETIRCNRLLQSGYKIISENSIDLFKSDSLFTAPYDKLVELTKHLLNNTSSINC